MRTLPTATSALSFGAPLYPQIREISGSAEDAAFEDCDHVVRGQDCETCSCGAVGGRTKDGHCRLGEACGNYPTSFEPLPPPLPTPKFSFHKRVMPPNLMALSSPGGKKLFVESLSTGFAESYFPLAEQFINQSEPAFCGVTTLCMVLNAMSVDPNVRWKSGWRWYGDDSVVLSNCCLSAERVRRVGVTVEEFVSLGRCQGAQIIKKRPCGHDSESDAEKGWDVEQFREDVMRMVQHPPAFVPEDGSVMSSSKVDGTDGAAGFLVVSYARACLGQTGGGHFSPVAAYHPETDMCLILDVARFKYAPYWVSLRELYNAMQPLDDTTGRSRGWFLMFPPQVFQSQGGYHLAKKDEGKRPAEVVPQVGERDICPMGQIKVEFCKVGRTKEMGGTKAAEPVSKTSFNRSTSNFTR